MSETPEYLKQPDHVERASQFINQVETIIVPKYRDLYIMTDNFQGKKMDHYDNVLREGLPFKTSPEVDARVVNWFKRWSDYAEQEAVDQIDVAVHIWRDSSRVGPKRIDAFRRDFPKQIKKAKEEVERLASRFGAEKDEVGDITEERDPDGIYYISTNDFFTFRRK